MHILKSSQKLKLAKLLNAVHALLSTGKLIGFISKIETCFGGTLSCAQGFYSSYGSKGCQIFRSFPAAIMYTIIEI